MNKFFKPLGLLTLLVSSHLYAAAYDLPPSSESLIGKTEYKQTAHRDTVTKIAQQYNLGYNAIKSANPQLNVDKRLPEGKLIQIPTQHLLPDISRKGVVVNLPEMRIYFYPHGSGEVLTYPIGIGKIGKTIPIKRAKITRKKKNPSWVPPRDIRESNLKKGIILPRIMPPGPDNPLGKYAVYMSIPTYLMHSTIYPNSIGRRASYGCLRMYESDIKDLFPVINGGMPIVIINKPVKVGWEDKTLYMEAHQPLEEHKRLRLNDIVKEIADETKSGTTLVDWQAVSYLAKERDGIPHDIGVKL